MYACNLLPSYLCTLVNVTGDTNIPCGTNTTLVTPQPKKIMFRFAARGQSHRGHGKYSPAEERNAAELQTHDSGHANIVCA